MEPYDENQTENTWTKITWLFKGVFPNIDYSKAYIYIYGEKYFSTELRSTIPKVKMVFSRAQKYLSLSDMKVY